MFHHSLEMLSNIESQQRTQELRFFFFNKVTSFKSKLQTRYLLALTTKLLTLTELLKAVVMLSSTHSSTSTSASAKTLIVMSLQYQQPESHQWSRLNSSIIKAYQIWLIMNLMRRLLLMKSSTFPKYRRSECCRDVPSPSCTRTPFQTRQGPCTASWGKSWNIRCPVDFKC